MDAADSGLGEFWAREGEEVRDAGRVPLSCRVFPLGSRSDSPSEPKVRASFDSLSLRETDRGAAGEAGGGITTPLGIRARGVLFDARLFDGVDVGVPTPIPVIRLPKPGFGVVNGDEMRVGEVLTLGEGVGDERGRGGLSRSPGCREYVELSKFRV